MYNIKVTNIVVPYIFCKSKPHKYKMNKIRKYVQQHGEIDKPIIVKGNKIIDGYTRYLVAIEYGLMEIPCMTVQEYMKQNSNAFTYIVGKFNNSRKEYVWRLEKGEVNIGDKVLVRSDQGKAVVTVIKTFVSDDVNLLKHKTVIKIFK